jgi:hypothetical protein
MARKKKRTTPWTFKITETLYDENFKEYKNVLLDGEAILKLDFTTYMGHRRNQTPELLEVLSSKIGRVVTKDELNRAMMLGTLDP